MPSDAEIDALIEQARLYAQNDKRRPARMLREAAAFLAALRDERDGLERGLRTVQNAAKTIASAQGTELEHLRQNRTYDYKLRQEHESLLERDAQMTDALLTAEARVRELEQKLERAEDKIDGLQADLDGAIEVAFRRGATDWTWMNYPSHFERLTATLAEIGQRG